MRPAYSDRSAPPACLRRILVRPVAVLVEEAARFLLAVAEGVAAHRDLREECEQERRKARADDPEPAVQRGAAWVYDDQDQPGERQHRRQHVADDEQRPPVLPLLAHDPFSAPRTRSSCSAGFTFRNTSLTLPSGPITNVERSMPMYFLPY